MTYRELRREPQPDWANLSPIFHTHDLYRQWREERAGLFEEQIRNAFVPHIPAQARVVEFGTGAGVLFNTLQRDLPEGVQWLETDASEECLAIPRPTAREMAMVSLPETPFEANSFDAVATLAMLDTLPPGVLQKTMHEFARILKSGGRVVHALDMGTNPNYLVRQAAKDDRLAMPAILHTLTGEVAGTGVSIISKPRLRGMMYVIDLTNEEKGIISALLNETEETIYELGSQYPIIFQYLENKMQQAGLVEETIDLWDYFSRNLVASAEEAGLIVCEAGVHEAQKDVRSKNLPQGYPDDVAIIEKRFGAASTTSRQEFPQQPRNRVTIKTNSLVHVFQKP